MRAILDLTTVLWLIALTILYASLVRHLIGLTLPRRPARVKKVVNNSFPAEAAEALGRGNFISPDFVAAIFSSGCATCLARARKVGRFIVDPENTAILITGSQENGIEDLRQALAGTRAALIYDPEAQTVVDALKIDGTPFAFCVKGGYVVAQSNLHRTEQFGALADLAQSTLKGGEGVGYV